MKNISAAIHKFEFEYRIFVSLSIVLLTCFISFKYFAYEKAIVQLLGSAAKVDLNQLLTYMYIFIALFMVPLSILRMWAGSLLSSKRVMSFKIVDDLLVTDGPYILTRNPIYFSDLAAITAMSLCLPLPGLLMPVLFYIHYRRLISYEEASLSGNFNKSYRKFIESVPVLIPGLRSAANFLAAEKKIFINRDGFKNNSLYVLFIPGFIAAAVLNSFPAAVIIGAPGVLYWAIVHTKIGFKRKEKAVSSKSKIFKGVLYAQCWEDPEIDRVAFNIKETDTVFSITSGGCNVLTFLLDNPNKVIALDLNPHQNYLLELKIAAIKNLHYEDFLAFMGVTECRDRIRLYYKLRGELTARAFAFWDKNTHLISNGLIHCGRYERYMRLLRRALIIMIGKKNIEKFFNTFGYSEFNDLYEKKWNNRRWKIFTKVLLSRRTMSLLFDKHFFTFVNDSFSFGDNFAAKTRYALTSIPVRSNYFLSYILLENYFDVNNLPSYLRIENFETLRSRLDRIVIINDSCENYFHILEEGSINKFNFTNIFEWMSPEQFENLLKETVRVSANHGIITYRNLLVPREHPESLNSSIKSYRYLSESLHKRDRSFIYNNYIVEEIIREEKKCHSASRVYQEEKR